MEITLQHRLTRTFQSLRLAFWRAAAAMIAMIMRAPRSLRAMLVIVPFLVVGSLAYWLGRAAGNLLIAYLP
jgi:hypothetical protein